VWDEATVGAWGVGRAGWRLCGKGLPVTNHRSAHGLSRSTPPPSFHTPQDGVDVLVGPSLSSNLLLVKGTCSVPAIYTELCQFFYGEDPERLE
jgi:hypothetical protein